MNVVVCVCVCVCVCLGGGGVWCVYVSFFPKVVDQWEKN